MTSNETVYLLLPELVLVFVATLIYVAGAFWPQRGGWNWLAAVGLFLAGAGLFTQLGAEPLHSVLYDNASGGGLLSGPLVVDWLSIVSRGLIIGVGFLFVMITSRTAADTQEPEYMGSLLLLITGLNIIAMSNDLVLVFLGLELVSIPTYVLLFLGSGHVEHRAQRQEAATKYFFLSVLSSSVLLYGFSFFYGATGSTRLFESFQKFNDLKAGQPIDTLARLAMVLIFAGLGFRITAVPFHFYAPDVYQGTSNPNAGLLAVVPKIAGLLALIRIVMVGMPGLERTGWQLTLAMAIVTMTLGNLLALWQNNVRRLLAYSSIAHAGYMLIGLSVGFATAGRADTLVTIDGVGSTLFYLMVYSLATAGAFAAITYLGGSGQQVDTLEDLAGLSQSHPRTAVAMAIFMFSLTGLPPLAGFWGKLGLLTGALGIFSNSKGTIDDLGLWFLALSIITALNAAISAGYYLRVVAVMYFRPSLTAPPATGGVGAATAMFMCAVLVVGLGIDPGPWQEGAHQVSRAAQASFQSRRTMPPTTPPPVAAAAKLHSNR